MWERVLRQIKEKVRNGQYILTTHAEEEMDNDGLTLDDVENGILTGKVQAQQKDTITAGWKYRIQGETVAGSEVEIVAKIGATGKAVIITVYLL